MRRTIDSARFRREKAGASRALLAVALLAVAGLSGLLAGCGAGSEFLPSNLPGAGGGVFLITTATLEDGVINRSYSKAIDTVGGTPPVTNCSIIIGALPAGMGVAPMGSQCILSGTPTASGTFNFTLRADDSTTPLARNDTQDYTLVIRQEYSITTPAPDPLPVGVEDRAYSFAFTVMTNTVSNGNDVGQVGEFGNGPLTACGVTAGLPTGMTSMVSNLTANSCTITLGGTPNVGLVPGSMPMAFALTVSVTDTSIGGSNVPAATISQTAVDLVINPPMAFTLITSDPATTNPCTGGTFNDALGGGQAPQAVNGRPYGAPTGCDLLFTASGGIAPYTWMGPGGAPPMPFGCTQSGVNGEFFTCNSANAAITTPGNTATNFTVQVQDTANAAVAQGTQGTDVNGHGSHVIFVNNAISVVSSFGPVLPTAVRLRMYGDPPDTPANFTAAGGLGLTTGYVFTAPVGGIMNGDPAFPATIACNPTAPGGNVLSCATGGNTISAAAGTYTPTVQADDVRNDTTPNSVLTMTFGTVPVSIDVVDLPVFTFMTADAGTTNPCTGGTFDDTMPATIDAIRAVTGRTYGGPAQCDLLFQVTGGRVPFTWSVNQAAPAPIGCTQEGVNGERFRCNSGGASISGATAALGVQVTDTGNPAVSPVTRLIDDLGHGNHTIGVQGELLPLTITPVGPPLGVTGRAYGTPGGSQDLVISVAAAQGLSPVTMQPDENTTPGESATRGFPVALQCRQPVGTQQIDCTTGAGVITDPAGTYNTVVTAQDAGNDTTPAGSIGQGVSVFIVDEIQLVSDLGNPLPPAVQGQPYGEAPATPPTFTASNGLGGYIFSTMTGGMNNGDPAFPATIGCSPAGSIFTCRTNASTITAGVGTYTPTVNADDAGNATTPSSAAAGTTAMVAVSMDVTAGMMFSLITADPATTNPCTGGTFNDANPATIDAIRGVIVRPYGGPARCDLLFQVSGGRPPFTWAENAPAPAPIACTQEGVNNERFRCNSGGVNVSGSTASLAVQVSDTGDMTVPAATITLDDQGHGGHTIGIQNQLAISASPQGATPMDAPDGVTGRPMGTPTGGQDLVFSVPSVSGLSPVNLTPDENTVAGSSAAAGFPAALLCAQTMDRETRCTTGAGVITDPAGLYALNVGATDTQNDTTPSAVATPPSFSLTINDEIVIDNTFLPNGVVGQSYNVQFTCNNGNPLCGGAGNPDNASNVYLWSEVAGPATPGLTVFTQTPTNPGTGLYSGTPTTSGTFTPTITLNDNANAVTPDCLNAGTCPTFSATFNVVPSLALVDASNNQIDTFTTDTGLPVFAGNIVLDAGSQPFRIAVTPNATFAVDVDSAESEADIINLVTGTITTVPVSALPQSVAIGPATNPLANPDSYVAYVASFAGNSVDVIDIDPNSVNFGTVITSVAITNPRDIAITPTIDPGTGPETRAYVLSGADDVCAIDAEPSSGSFLTQIDIFTGVGNCIDTSFSAGNTRFIEISSDGATALIVKTDGLGEPGGIANVVSLPVSPTSTFRDTGAFSSAGVGAGGCFLPADLRSRPGIGQQEDVLLLCGTDTTTGDRILLLEPSPFGPNDPSATFTFAGTTFLTAGDGPRDIALSPDGNLGLVTLGGTTSIKPLTNGASTPQADVALPNVVGPDGIAHVPNPASLRIVSGTPSSAVSGNQFYGSYRVLGGVRPFQWSEPTGTFFDLVTGAGQGNCTGLTLDLATGILFGTPTMTNTTCGPFTIMVTDSTPGAPQTTSLSGFTINIIP